MWVPENAVSLFQSKISLCLKHDMTTSLAEGGSFACRGGITVALKLAWWLEQQNAALKAGTATQRLLAEEQAEALTSRCRALSLS